MKKTEQLKWAHNLDRIKYSAIINGKILTRMFITRKMQIITIERWMLGVCVCVFVRMTLAWRQWAPICGHIFCVTFPSIIIIAAKKRETNELNQTLRTAIYFDWNGI